MYLKFENLTLKSKAIGPPLFIREVASIGRSGKTLISGGRTELVNHFEKYDYLQFLCW